MTEPSPTSKPTTTIARQRRRDMRTAARKLQAITPEAAQALFTADTMFEAVSVLERNLKATKRQWSQAEREFIEVPDCSTQVEAAKILLAYGVGQPVERVLSVQQKFEPYDEFEKRAMQSPAFRRSIEESYEKLKANPLPPAGC